MENLNPVASSADVNTPDRDEQAIHCPTIRKPEVGRRLTLSIVGGALSVCTFSQAYRQLVLPGARWDMYYMFEGAWNFDVLIGSDTTIDGQAYHVVGHNQMATIDGIREDTTTRKVYVKHGVEHLLYDFSVVPGDTVDVISYGGANPGPLVLDSITATPPCAAMEVIWPQPRFYYLHMANYPDEHPVWLEGVGGVRGLLNPADGWACVAGPPYDLFCHSDSAGMRDYHFTDLWVNGDSCSGGIWGGVREGRAIDNWCVTFIAGEEVLDIRLPTNSVAGAILLTDPVGRVVDIRTSFSADRVTIHTAGLARGMYLVSCDGENGKCSTRRVMIE